jgi:hypothetical protein
MSVRLPTSVLHLTRFASIDSFCCAVAFGFWAKATLEDSKHAAIASAEQIKISRFTIAVSPCARLHAPSSQANGTGEINITEDRAPPAAA